MRIISKGLTTMLSSGRRQTRFGLTGVEAEPRPRRQRVLFRAVLFFGNCWEGLWKARMSQAGIGSNNSLKQNAPVSLFQLERPTVAFCLARIR
jgi:hypothetical protein